MEELQNFLNEYTLLGYKEPDKNFFQIAGFPHYENVSSNVLGFFLKDKLILKIFLDCIHLKYDTSNDYVDIQREASTESNKRIDILISTKRYIIGIENKIHAVLYNPIDEYCSFLSDCAKEENKESYLVVLSKNKVQENKKYKTILYKDFSAKLKEYYPDLLNNLGYRYFLFLTEYIANIDYLEGAYFMMDKEFAKIAGASKENLAKITDIWNKAKRLRSDLINIGNQIIIDLKDYSDGVFSNISNDNDPQGIWATVYFQDFSLPEYGNLRINIHVDASGFEIEIMQGNYTPFDENYKYLLHEMIHDDLWKKFKDDTGIGYAWFALDDYDGLLTFLKTLFNDIKKYVESKKTTV